MGTKVGSAPRPVGDRAYTGIRTALLGLTVGVLAAAVDVSASAATQSTTPKPTNPHRAPPLRRPAPPQQPQNLPPATLSLFGDQPDLKVTNLDNVPWERAKYTLPIQDPRAQVREGDYATVAVALVPGVWLIHAKYFRNIDGGVSFVQGSVRLTALPGHTYMVHPSAGTGHDKVSFSVVDYGTGFPPACLPGAISNATQSAPPGQTPRRVRVTREQITSCAQQLRARRN